MIKIVSEYKKQSGNSNQFLQTGLIQMATWTWSKNLVHMSSNFSYLFQGMSFVCTQGFVICIAYRLKVRTNSRLSMRLRMHILLLVWTNKSFCL